MEKRSKRLALIVGIFMFLASINFIFSPLPTNVINNNDEKNQNDNASDNIDEKNNSPLLAALNSKNIQGSTIGIIGRTDGVKSGTTSLTDWAYPGAGIYYTTDSNFGGAEEYSIPYPVFSSGTITPDWVYQGSTIDVFNLIEENDFFWDKDFNTGSWSNSAPLGDDLEISQRKQDLDSNRDFYNDNIAMAQFYSNDITDNYIYPTSTAEDWESNTANSYSKYHLAQNQNSHDGSWRTYSGTYLDETTGNGDYQTSHSSSHTETTGTSGGLNVDSYMQVGYFVRRSDPESHDHDDWSRCGIQFDDTYTYEYSVEWNFDYSYDGTPPEDVDFRCYISGDVTVDDIYRQGSTMTYDHTTTITVILYNNDRSRSLTLVSNSKTADFGEWKYYNNIQSFFTEDGPYRLRVIIRNVLHIDLDYVQKDLGSAGTCTLTYADVDSRNNGPAYIRFNVNANNFRFDFDEEKPYTTGECYVQTTINFNGRYIKANPIPQMEFDYSIQNELIDNQESNTFQNGKIFCRVEYDHGSGYTQYDYDEWSIVTGNSAHATMNLDFNKLNQSINIRVSIGIKINSGFEIEYGSGGDWARILFANPYMYIKSVPKTSDVGLELGWKGTKAGTEVFPSGGVNGQGTLNLPTSILDLTKSDSVTFYFRSTSQKLSFNYEHKLFAKFEYFNLQTTIRIVNGSQTIHIDTSFNWVVPHNKTLLKSGYDYSDSFEFNITFPRWVQNGEPYWDLDQAYLRSGTYEETADTTETLPWPKEDTIYVMENTPYLSFTDTQIAQVDNDLFDEYLLVNNFDQYWEFNFSCPNTISNLIMDDNSDFGSPTFTLLKGNISNVRLEYSDSISSGTAGALWLNSSEQYQHSNTLAASGTSTSFTGLNGWDTSSANLGNYYIVGNYTDTESGKSMPSGMQGINRIGYIYKPFSVVIDTVIQSLTVTPKIYDTRTNGKNGDKIEIAINWTVKGGNPITGGNARISIAYWVINASGENKYPVTPAEWLNVPMKEIGNGIYKVWIDPTFYGHEGNITWGYHNFTITISKPNYMPKTIKGDFYIIVDTVLKIIDPDNDRREPISNHPHFKYGIMGGNDSGTPSDYMTVFSLYFYENLSSPTYFTNNPGNPYRYMVEINYTCINYTKGDLSWWNWTWNHDKFSTNNNGNPINGTFKSSGNEWQATIYFPQKNTPYFKNIAQYKSGIFLEYNITVRVFRNMTYPAPSGKPWKFQPNIVQNQSCESGYIDTDPIREETILLKLIEPEEGNFTRLVVLNKPQDGRPFAMGTYNNNSNPTVGKPYDNPTYILKNYYKNETLNPNTGKQDNEFRIRVLFNCSYVYQAGKTKNVYPPCGPINTTLNTTIKMYGWSDDPISLIYDNTTLWSCTVYDNISMTYRTFYGYTYVTPWLKFSSKRAGTYTLSIKASLKGYVESEVILTVEILNQKTEVLDEENNTLSSSITANTVTLNRTVPYGNKDNFIISYNDITNLPTKYPIIGATITCISDTLTDYGNPFENGQYEGKATWSWKDNGNGTYTIFINYTRFPNFIEVDKDSMARINFQIDKQNYSARIFTVILNITKRKIEIKLLDSNNINIYSEIEQYWDFKLITFEYQIIDLDSEDNSSIDFEIENNKFKEGPKDNFVFKYWNSTIPITTTDYFIFNKIVSGTDISYNISIDTHNINVGTYNLMFKITHSIYKTTSFNTTFTVVEAPFHIDLINQSTSVEYLISTISKINTPEYQPYIEFNLIDTVHTEKSGNTYYVDYTGMTIWITSGNYSNPYYNNMNTILPNPCIVHEDLAVEAGTYSPGYLKIYVDIQRMDAKSDPYRVNLSLSKPNYKTLYILFNFTISNASTKFDSLYFDFQEGPSYPSKAKLYTPGEHLNIPWNKMVSIYFEYKSIDPKAGLSNTLLDISNINYSIVNFKTSPNNWLEFATIRTFTDNGDGTHNLRFITNTSTIGSLDVSFNITVWAKNFAPITILINFTIHDRNTEYTILSVYDKVPWTGKASIEFYYLDKDYYNSSQGTSTSYKEPILGALINGTNKGQIDFGNGEIANWTLKEREPDLQENLRERYEIEITSDKLKVGKEYIVYLQITKDHYKSHIITFNFSITKIDIIVNVTVKPDNKEASEEYNANDVKEIWIYVTVFVELQNGTGTVEVNKELPLPNITITYVLSRGDKEIYTGELVWDDSAEAFVAKFSAKDEKDVPLTGIYSLYIIVNPNHPNIQNKTVEIKLLGLGEIPGEAPLWVWILAAIFIGGLVGMGAYSLKKLIYLRIPYVLRKIDETIKKIEKDKYPPVGVMTGREIFIINNLLNYLEECGIEWEREDKFEIKKTGEAAIAKEKPPLNEQQIIEELSKIPNLSKEEIALFTEELKRLDRSAQDEFLASLRGDLESD
ncbi:MAG: hypothetical protein ACP6IY_02525 [Promethearchaeia archaeon]